MVPARPPPAVHKGAGAGTSPQKAPLRSDSASGGRGRPVGVGGVRSSPVKRLRRRTSSVTIKFKPQGWNQNAPVSSNSEPVRGFQPSEPAPSTRGEDPAVAALVLLLGVCNQSPSEPTSNPRCPSHHKVREKMLVTASNFSVTIPKSQHPPLPR